MSLTAQQQENTRRELRENFEKSGLALSQVAADLSTSTEYIEQLFRLEPKRYEDTWILKNYLCEKVVAAGKTPTPFSALAGDYHKIWFLYPAYIDGKKIY